MRCPRIEQGWQARYRTYVRLRVPFSANKGPRTGKTSRPRGITRPSRFRDSPAAAAKAQFPLINSASSFRPRPCLPAWPSPLTLSPPPSTERAHTPRLCSRAERGQQDPCLTNGRRTRPLAAAYWLRGGPVQLTRMAHLMVRRIAGLDWRTLHLVSRPEKSWRPQIARPRETLTDSGISRLQCCRALEIT